MADFYAVALSFILYSAEDLTLCLRQVTIGGETLTKKRELKELTSDTFLKLEEGEEIEVKVAHFEKGISNNYDREVNRFSLEVVDGERYEKGSIIIWESTSSGAYNLARTYAKTLDNVEIAEDGTILSDFRKSYVIKRDSERLYTVFSIA